MAHIITQRIYSRNFRKFTQYILLQRNFKHNASVVGLNFNANNVFMLMPRSSIYSVVNDRIQPYSNKCSIKEGNKKPSLFQRFKEMYKNYWYVLVPVHLVTSAIWFGSFYYLAKSGVDIVAILESLHLSEKIINPLKDSSLGYVAVAYGLYKVATPARYTVTLGGTTISITYLKKWGYIKPVPSKERLKEMYLEGKDNLIESVRETKEGLKIQSEKLKEKKEDFIEDIDKGIKQIKVLGEKINKSKEHVMEGVKKKKDAVKYKD